MWYGSVVQICSGCFGNTGIIFCLSLGKEKPELLYYVWERFFIFLPDFKVPVEEYFVVAVAKDVWMVSTWPWYEQSRIQIIVSVHTIVQEFLEMLLIPGKCQIFNLYLEMLALNCSSGKTCLKCSKRVKTES